MLQDHKITTALSPDNITMTINVQPVFSTHKKKLIITINATLDQMNLFQHLSHHAIALVFLSILTETRIVKELQQASVFTTSPTASPIHPKLVDISKLLLRHQLSLSITFSHKMNPVDQEVPEEPQMEETELLEETELEL